MVNLAMSSKQSSSVKTAKAMCPTRLGRRWNEGTSRGAIEAGRISPGRPWGSPEAGPHWVIQTRLGKTPQVAVAVAAAVAVEVAPAVAVMAAVDVVAVRFCLQPRAWLAAKCMVCSWWAPGGLLVGSLWAQGVRWWHCLAHGGWEGGAAEAVGGKRHRGEMGLLVGLGTWSLLGYSTCAPLYHSARGGECSWDRVGGPRQRSGRGSYLAAAAGCRAVSTSLTKLHRRLWWQ